MPTEIPPKLLHELADGLLIAYRVKEHRLAYSLMNRPEPTLSGVDDHALATALLIAGHEFEFTLDKDVMKAERVVRDDGTSVRYNQAIDVDWEDRVIRGTRPKEATLKILSLIIDGLMRQAAAPTPGTVAPDEPPN